METKNDILQQLILTRSNLIKKRELINAKGINLINDRKKIKNVLLRKKQISSLISSITSQIEEIKNTSSA